VGCLHYEEPAALVLSAHGDSCCQQAPLEPSGFVLQRRPKRGRRPADRDQGELALRDAGSSAVLEWLLT
jgi:hypothetical protein